MTALQRDLNLLVIEDNPGDFVLIEEYLFEALVNPDVQHAKTYSEAKEILQTNIDFHAILLDLTLPDLSGEDLVQKMVEISGQVPIIVLTGHENRDFALKTLSMGVADYLLKDEMSSFVLDRVIAYSIERSRINKSIKKSEKKYRDIFNFSPLPMWIFDVDTFEFVDVNHAAILHYGYSRDEFLSKTILDIRPKEDIEITQKAVDSIRKDPFYSYQHKESFKHLKKNGETIDVDIKTSKLEENRNLAMVVAEDVTEKITAEKNLRQKSRLLAANAEIASALIENEDWLTVLNQTFNIIGKAVDVDRVYYFENHEDPKTGKLLTSQKIEWAADRVNPQLDNPELQDLVQSEYQELYSELAKGNVFQAVTKHVPESKFKQSLIQQNILSILAFPVFVENKFYGFIGFDDCSRERRWTNEEIRYLKTIASNISGTIQLRKLIKEQELSERRFRSLVQDGADLLAILDSEANYKYVAPTSERILNIKPEEFIGKNALSFIHPEDQQQVFKELSSLKPEEQSEVGPFRFSDGEGNWRWIESIITNMLQNPAVQGFVANSRDVTEEREYQENIKSTLKEKETLLAEIHHRVKNNLAVVSGMMQLQAFGSDNEELQSQLLDSVSRIKTMASVHELLYQSNSFSQLEFSETLKRLVENVSNTYHTDKEITLDIHCDPVTLNINLAIPASLIVNEVLTNAYKHAFKDRKNGKIKFKLKEQVDQICIEIADNGVGMSQKDMQKEKSLGMHLIEVLSEQLEGTKEYKSKGEGTTFTFTFPKKDEKGGIGNATMN